MAQSELDTGASRAPGWALLRPVATPGLVYRLAGWRPPFAIGKGRLAVHLHGRGCARFHYRNPGGEGRADCVRRQTWLLRVPASCGASKAALREEACLAQGDPACHYVMTWTGEVRLALVTLAGGIAAITMAVLSAATPAAWLLVPLVIAGTYMLERWRVAQANPLASAQSSAAFRWLVENALAARSRAPGEAPRDSGVSIEPEGDVWRVAHGGTTIRLRHSRGLALLAHLIRNPGQEIHVSRLDAITPSGSAAANGRSGVVAVSGDAGELLDAQARTDYRRRIAELRGELERSEANADLGHAEAARAELERLEDELRLAVGPGGRQRRAASDTERLRGAISHRIRAAITQIARRHPALGEHLTANVSTGYRCIYDPVGRRPIDEPATARREPKA